MSKKMEKNEEEKEKEGMEYTLLMVFAPYNYRRTRCALIVLHRRIEQSNSAALLLVASDPLFTPSW